MHELLVMPVNGVSPQDELDADYAGNVVALTVSDIEARISNRNCRVYVVYVEGRQVGWGILKHINRLDEIRVVVADAWQYTSIITDKTLPPMDRLAVVNTLLLLAARDLDAATYIWGDIKASGNLTNYFMGIRPGVPIEQFGVNCIRYYQAAGEIVVRLG